MKQQLGMSRGRASNLLKKHIMFRLLEQLKQLACYKCGKIIESPNRLSVEHKRSWFRVDTKLFWDLNNVAFSHTRCNRPDRPFDIGGLNRAKTHCKRGHKLPQTRNKNGGRVCKICKNQTEKLRKQRLRSGNSSRARICLVSS